MRVSREQAAKNRETILDVASKMFRRHGIDGIGIADLMKESGLTHGALYSHFQSKDDLVAATCEHATKKGVDRWTRVAEEAVADEADPLEAVVRMYLSQVHRENVDQGCLLPALASEIARQPPETRRIFTESLNHLITLLATHSGARSKDAARRNAMATLSAMVGAIIFARAVDDEALSDEFLAAVSSSLLAGRTKPK